MATVMIIDGGGRGSALVEKYLESPNVKKVIAIPGNDLMLLNKNVRIYPNLKTTDKKQILKIAKVQNVDLVDVAQDDAVAAGITDYLEENGINVLGPTKNAGRIEWDKAWSRDFMKKFQIPAPEYRIFRKETDGIKFISSRKNRSWYIKASGLAAGKGALYAESKEEAVKRIKEMKNFGNAGQTFLVEECLEGEEFSSFALVDGKHFLIVGHAQDHKTVFNGNEGANTGGMGCSSPPLLINKKIEKQISEIFKKTVNGLNSLGSPYKGVLYLGGIVDKRGKVHVIEFNARWGDPEAQVIVPSIKNDFYDLMQNLIRGKLTKVKTDNVYRVALTAASKGYPGDYSDAKDRKIFNLENLTDVKVFGAGIKHKNGVFKTAGGRLFYIVGEGRNVIAARKKAYEAISQIFIEGNNLHYRTDIGYRDVERFYNRIKS